MVAGRATALAAGLAIVAVGGPRVVGLLRTDQPAGPTPSPSVAAPDFSSIAGTYAVELTNGDATVAANYMAGTWTIELGADGTMQLSIPAGFTQEDQAPAGSAFSLSASQFRTNLFYSDVCHSVGVYGGSSEGLA